MKICMVFSLPFPPKEGIGNYIYFLSKKLLKKGYNVVVITRGSWRKTEREIIDEIEVIRAPFQPIYPFYLQLHGMYVRKIFQLLEPEIDLVHFHSPLPPFIRTERPIVTTIHTPMLIDYRIEKLTSIHSMFSKIMVRFISYPLEKKLLDSSKIIMTVTNTIVQELKEEYSIDSNKVFVVGNGVDTNFFLPGKQESNDDQRYILFAGWIENRKGIFDLLECARDICAKRSDVTFLLAGQGSQFNRLKQKIITSGLQDRFLLLGQVKREKLLKLYQKATLFVFPSYHEGLPTVLLEAMSCGVPIIATDVRGNRDVITKDKNGILVPPGNPQKLAEAISFLLDNETLRKTFSRNGRQLIEENFTWDKISEKVIQCYQQALEMR